MTTNISSQTTVCPICHIQMIDGQFYWSYPKSDGDRAANTKEVYSKVCVLAKMRGKEMSTCLNKEGSFDRAKTWEALDSDILNQIETN